jgi:hypothetical protein
MLACDSKITLLLLLLIIVIVELGSGCLIVYTVKFPIAEHKRYCLLNATAFFYLKT